MILRKGRFTTQKYYLPKISKYKYYTPLSWLFLQFIILNKSTNFLQEKK